MKKLMVLPLLFVILVSFSANAAGPGKRDWQWWDNEDIVKELGLSEDQSAQTKEIASKFQPLLKEANDTYLEKKTAYKDAKSNPEASSGDVIKAFDSMWDSKYKMSRVKLDRDLEMKAVLTPEQTTKLNEIRAEHREKMMKRHHKMKDKKHHQDKE